MGAARYVVVESSPFGVSLTWGAVHRARCRRLGERPQTAQADCTFTTSSLHTPIARRARGENRHEAAS